jgi:uncharacterized protein
MNPTWAAGQFHFASTTITALKPGKRLIVCAAVHGNEVCGTHAIRRVLAEIAAGTLPVLAGSVTFVPVTNPLAFHLRQRNGDRNLNRNLYPQPQAQDFEDHLANWLCPLLASHQVLLDLHSFNSGGQPFALLGPTDNSGALEPFTQATSEQELVVRLGVNRFVDGWLDTYARGVQRRVARTPASQRRVDLLNTDTRYGVGTTEYMRAQGGCAVTLECGQHDDPAAPEVAYQAILNTMAWCGLIAPRAVSIPSEREMVHLYDVIDRYDEADTFSRSWASFDPLEAGMVIGTRANGELVRAEHAGYIVFPNVKAAPGQEWFYLAERSNRL